MKEAVAIVFAGVVSVSCAGAQQREPVRDVDSSSGPQETSNTDPKAEATVAPAEPTGDDCARVEACFVNGKDYCQAHDGKCLLQSSLEPRHAEGFPNISSAGAALPWSWTIPATIPVEQRGEYVRRLMQLRWPEMDKVEELDSFGPIVLHESSELFEGDGQEILHAVVRPGDRERVVLLVGEQSEPNSDQITLHKQRGNFGIDESQYRLCASSPGACLYEHDRNTVNGRFRVIGETKCPVRSEGESREQLEKRREKQWREMTFEGQDYDLTGAETAVQRIGEWASGCGLVTVDSVDLSRTRLGTRGAARTEVLLLDIGYEIGPRLATELVLLTRVDNTRWNVALLATNQRENTWSEGFDARALTFVNEELFGDVSGQYFRYEVIDMTSGFGNGYGGASAGSSGNQVASQRTVLLDDEGLIERTWVNRVTQHEHMDDVDGGHSSSRVCDVSVEISRSGTLTAKVVERSGSSVVKKRTERVKLTDERSAQLLDFCSGRSSQP